MKNKYPDLWLFFYLFSRSIFLISILSLAGIFLGQIISFFKTGSHIYFVRVCVPGVNGALFRFLQGTAGAVFPDSL